MEAFLIPGACCVLSGAQKCTGSRFSAKVKGISRGDVARHTFSVRCLELVRMQFLLETRSSLLVHEHSSPMRLPALHDERTPMGRSSIFRLNGKLVKKTVRAGKEPCEADSEDEPMKMDSSNKRPSINRAESVQTSMQIFSSTMFWIGLFFMASIWDGDNQKRKGRRGRGSRK